MKKIQVQGYWVPLAEAEHDLDDPGQATEEDQAGGGLVVQHLYPSSENCRETHPLHHQEEEPDTCAIISFDHVIAGYESRFLHLVNIVDSVISSSEGVLVLLACGQLAILHHLHHDRVQPVVDGLRQDYVVTAE